MYLYIRVLFVYMFVFVEHTSAVAETLHVQDGRDVISQLGNGAVSNAVNQRKQSQSSVAVVLFCTGD